MKMKKLTTLVAIAIFSTSAMYAETTFKLNAAGDAYFVTDNDKIGFKEFRKFAAYNPVKGQTALNHAFLIGRVENDQWKVNVGAGFRGDLLQLHIEEANVAVNLVKGLWIEGGYYIPSLTADVDYTFDAWFSGNSLTDAFTSDYQAGMGLFYQFEGPGITARLRAINTGYVNEENPRYSNNRSTSFLIGVDWDIPKSKDWSLSVGTIIGNEEEYPAMPKLKTNTGLLLKGKIIDDLEANLRVRFATLADAKIDGVDTSMGTALSAQLMLRYAITEKFGVGCRFAYTIDEDTVVGLYGGKDHFFNPVDGANNYEKTNGASGIDLGLSFEYRPLESVYVRLEGNVLIMSNTTSENAKIFRTSDGNTGWSNTRMEAALSIGYNFNLYELVK